MKQTTYSGHNYIISDTHNVWLVSDSTGKRRWLRVYDMGLSLAIREDHANRQVRYEVSEMDEAAQDAHWAERGYL